MDNDDDNDLEAATAAIWIILASVALWFMGLVAIVTWLLVG